MREGDDERIEREGNKREKEKKENQDLGLA